MAKNLDHYKKVIERFSKSKILVIGDLMVDQFIRGKVSRISPEAPVPVVLVNQEDNLPGGAGNVIMNLASLGAEVHSCGVIGNDEPGKKLIQHFRKLGVKTSGVKTDRSFSTILKSRVIAEHQQVVRFDKEVVNGFSPQIHSDILRGIENEIRAVDGVILSDYGKGLINRALLTKVIQISRRLKKPVCVDPKLEHFLLYKNVTCITPNLGEALGGMHQIKLDPVGGVKKLGASILKKLRCDSLLLTQGEEGMTLFEKSKSTHIPTKAREVFDVTGAGDTVISVMSLCLTSGANFSHSAVLANLAAGIVVGKLGTATVSPQELKDSLKFL